MDKAAKLLIIEDDPIFRNLYRSILKVDFELFLADRPSIGINILETEQIDLVITDFKLPEMNGLKLLSHIKEHFPSIEVIVVSSSDDMNTAIGALRNGATDYIKKPFTTNELRLSIERAQKISTLNNSLKRAKAKNLKLKEEVNKKLSTPIIGTSPLIQEIKSQIQLVAQTPDTSVLIIGESGTGKEIVARGIHDMSKRKDEFFGAVNMAAIPEALFESEFFGHKKGSFTGAIADKAGWFESTNHGTLFLDEIGEMPLSLQVKLLRVLEERAYVKVGTQAKESFDIRLIGATNKSTDELATGDGFRLDLFHRLGTFIIQIPPLRKRTEDIPLLAEYFLTDFSTKMAKKINGIHADTLKVFEGYSFPGNIRELRNIMERAVIVCQGDLILPKHIILSSIEKSNKTHTPSPDEIFDLVELEKRTIERALQKVNFNKAEAARILNIEWNALYRRIQKHRIKLE